MGLNAVRGTKDRDGSRGEKAVRSHIVQLREPTEQLYSRARDRGRRAMFWAGLAGRSRCLLALEEVWPGSHVSSSEQSHLDGGIRLVPIAKIVGSEGRCGDFDRDFNPLHDRNRGRWLYIAAARRRGTLLPPVDLVQVGRLYYVQDGHHRISVARALGQTDIEARVTIWHHEAYDYPLGSDPSMASTAAASTPNSGPG
jgi:hypothetical protein